MGSRLTFARNLKRKVHWDDTLAGTLEPMKSAAGKWAFIPGFAANVPNALRRPVYRRTQREIKSYLRRQVRLADV